MKMSMTDGETSPVSSKTRKTSSNFLLEHQERAIQAFDQQRRRVVARVRKAVMGHESKSFSDLVNERRNEPAFLKFLEQFSFFLGVSQVCVCEYFVLVLPDYFYVYYAVTMPFLLYIRTIRFHQQHYDYFLLDLCYLTQVLLLLQTILFPWSTSFLKIVFLLANGPVAWAVPLWRNSLVFHDLDRMTSVFIHVYPMLLYYCTTRTRAVSDYISLMDVLHTMMIYLIWQIWYFIRTEIVDKRKLDSDLTIQTSLRWLVRDERNPTHQIVKSLLKLLGVMRRHENFDPRATKTKVIFMTSQFAYALVTASFAKLLYSNRFFYSLFVIFIISSSIYNGASWYVSVYSGGSSQGKSGYKNEEVLLKKNSVNSE